MRGNALESTVANYTALMELWEECPESLVRFHPDIKARIIGVKTIMSSFKFPYGLKLSETVLMITDNLSRALQKTPLSAAEGQKIASLTMTTLQKM